MPEADIRIEPLFLESPRGPLFCVFVSPSVTAVNRGILYLHPFAEEMHKSRRMAALQARAFAAQGCAVLQIDLTGCGDSAGDFGDASWSKWLDDVRVGYVWLSERVGPAISLWGLRIGALLAADISRSVPDLHSLLLWQPVTSGDVFLTQFLRIKLASEMLTGGQAHTSTKSLRKLLDAGESVEVGGYLLSPEMNRELGALNMIDFHPKCPVQWLEVGAEASEYPSPGSKRVVDAWREAGVTVITETVIGDPFWITQEIAECLALVTATLKGQS